MIAVDLSKHQALDPDPKAIQQINFTVNLDRAGNARIYFILEEARLSWNMIGDTETNFPHKLLLTNRQVTNLRKAFANHLPTDIKLSKTQLSKMIKSGGFLGRLLGPLLKTGLPLIKNVIKPLAKSVLIPLGLTAAASAADAGIHKKS